MFSLETDAQFSSTSIVNQSGTVYERYIFDAYGVATPLNANWSVQSGPGQDGAEHWRYLYKGGVWDALTKLYNNRNRDYSTTLGRWMEQDPAGYVDGASLYEMGVRNRDNRRFSECL